MTLVLHVAGEVLDTVQVAVIQVLLEIGEVVMTDGVNAFVHYFQNVPEEDKMTYREFDGSYPTMRERIKAGDTDEQIARDMFEAMDLSHPEDHDHVPTGGEKLLFIMNLADIVSRVREGDLK